MALRLAGGVGIPDVARTLDVAPSTVRTHAKSLYLKLDVHSQAELASLIDRITLFGRRTLLIRMCISRARDTVHLKVPIPSGHWSGE